MDRYTVRGPEGNAYYPKCFEGECFGMESREECEKCQMTFDICERLAAYEDLEVLPEQLRELDGMYKEVCEKLAEYQKLEEQGLLLRFPCKVGDKVWFVGETFVNDYEVRRFIIDETGIDCVQVAKEIDGRDYWNSCCYEDFGKTVFLSEVEAQEALKRLEGK